MNDSWAWLMLLGLGAFHGLNPAMGWLFAVALGLQEQRRAAVWRAFPAIALGHALSIGIIIAVMLIARVTVPNAVLKFAAAGVLFVFGVYRLCRSRHPKWVGMRVGFRDLTLWSFIMATAHGAGLMVIPLFLPRTQPQPLLAAAQLGPGMIDPICGSVFSTFSTPGVLATSVGIHTLGHFLAAAFVALVVYEKIGVGVLRRAWFNVDLFWTLALMISGLFVLLR